MGKKIAHVDRVYKQPSRTRDSSNKFVSVHERGAVLRSGTSQVTLLRDNYTRREEFISLIIIVINNEYSYFKYRRPVEAIISIARSCSNFRNKYTDYNIFIIIHISGVTIWIDSHNTFHRYSNYQLHTAMHQVRKYTCVLLRLTCWNNNNNKMIIQTFVCRGGVQYPCKST
jgi:hypothetical protein